MEAFSLGGSTAAQPAQLRKVYPGGNDCRLLILWLKTKFLMRPFFPGLKFLDRAQNNGYTVNSFIQNYLGSNYAACNQCLRPCENFP